MEDASWAELGWTWLGWAGLVGLCRRLDRLDWAGLGLGWG